MSNSKQSTPNRTKGQAGSQIFSAFMPKAPEMMRTQPTQVPKITSPQRGRQNPNRNENLFNNTRDLSANVSRDVSPNQTLQHTPVSQGTHGKQFIARNLDLTPKAAHQSLYHQQLSRTPDSSSFGTNIINLQHIHTREWQHDQGKRELSQNKLRNDYSQERKLIDNKQSATKDENSVQNRMLKEQLLNKTVGNLSAQSFFVRTLRESQLNTPNKSPIDISTVVVKGISTKDSFVSNCRSPPVETNSHSKSAFDSAQKEKVSQEQGVTVIQRGNTDGVVVQRGSSDGVLSLQRINLEQCQNGRALPEPPNNAHNRQHSQTVNLQHIADGLQMEYQQISTQLAQHKQSQLQQQLQQLQHVQVQHNIIQLNSQTVSAQQQNKLQSPQTQPQLKQQSQLQQQSQSQQQSQLQAQQNTIQKAASHISINRNEVDGKVIAMAGEIERLKALLNDSNKENEELRSERTE